MSDPLASPVGSVASGDTPAQSPTAPSVAKPAAQTAPATSRAPTDAMPMRKRRDATKTRAPTSSNRPNPPSAGIATRFKARKIGPPLPVRLSKSDDAAVPFSLARSTRTTLALPNRPRLTENSMTSAPPMPLLRPTGWGPPAADSPPKLPPAQVAVLTESTVVPTTFAVMRISAPAMLPPGYVALQPVAAFTSRST